MVTGLINKIAVLSEITPGFLSQILAGDRRPSWEKAKRLAANTATDPVLWMEGSPHELRAALDDLEYVVTITRNKKAVARVVVAGNNDHRRP